MKRIFITDLEVGMILGEAVFNQQNAVELLTKGTAIRENHIRMMQNLGMIDVLIGEELDSKSQSEHVNSIASYLVNNSYLSNALEEIKAIDYTEVVTSICNRNMQIQLITGEGNIPIDEKHKEVLEGTKKVFEQIRSGDVLDRESLEAQVEALLPDMLRNNDILMRLNQMKETDDYSFNHALRVSMLSSMIGKWLGYSDERLKELALTGLLFDIGKLKIPEEILLKKGPLTPSEMEIAQKHSQLGYLLLLKTPGITQDVKFAALQHHERLDGTGYPLKVKEGQIHEYSKIIMVADTFDAMIQNRVYKEKVSPFQAAEYIYWHSGSIFDAKICHVLLSNLSEFYLGKACVLSNGNKGRIVYIDINEPIRPIVQIDSQFIVLTKRRDLYISELD